MNQKSNFKIAIIISGVLSVAVVAFLIHSTLSNLKGNKTASLQAAISANINLPQQYAGPTVVTAFNNIFSITPVNAKSDSASQTDGQAVKYVEAYPNTDVIQTKQTNRLKEDIILKAPGHPDIFKYQIDLSKYDFQKDTKTGSIYFYTKGKKGDELYRLFTIPAPFMIDSKSAKSFDIKMELSEEGILTIEPNKEWLAKASYPITIDPTIEINIINIYSHPQQGQNWEVSFTTQGQADLKIIPNDQATIDDDVFVSLWCGNEQRTPQILPADIIYYPNWECDATAKVVHYTKKAGKHTLRFEFGSQTAFAYNDSGSVIALRNNVILKPNLIFRTANSSTSQIACCTAASTCNTPPAQCDGICEDFEGAVACGDSVHSNCRSGYSVVSTNTTIDFNAVPAATNLCTGTISSNSFQISADAASAGGYVRKTGFSLASAYIQFYLTVTAENFSDGQAGWFFAPSGGNGIIFYIRFLDVSNSLKLIIGYRNPAHNAVNSSTGATTIALNTMYRINIFFDSLGNITLKINGMPEITVTDLDTDTYPPLTSFYLGPIGTTANTYTMQIDNITIDDDTEPSACN